jgi:hypothetical protein
MGLVKEKMAKNSNLYFNFNSEVQCEQVVALIGMASRTQSGNGGHETVY